MRQTILFPVLLASSAFIFGRIAHAATVPYFNDFDSAGLPNASPGPNWSHDIINGEWDVDSTNPSAATVIESSEQITNIGTNGFVMRTRFRLDALENPPTGSASHSVGFGVLSPTPNFSASDPYYLVDWSLGNSTGKSTNLRILDHGGTGTTALDSVTLPSDIVVGAEYEMEFTAIPIGSSLYMTVKVFDGIGNQLGGTATATDTSPNTGQYFGYRNRIVATSSVTTETLQVDFDYLDIHAVPEPSSLVVLLGASGIGILTFRRKMF